jgi:hypothetical protein
MDTYNVYTSTHLLLATSSNKSFEEIVQNTVRKKNIFYLVVLNISKFMLD